MQKERKKKTYFRFENDLNGVKKVIWRNKAYDIGNRRHKKVELYRNNAFIRIVNACSLNPYLENN